MTGSKHLQIYKWLLPAVVCSSYNKLTSKLITCTFEIKMSGVCKVLAKQQVQCTDSL